MYELVSILKDVLCRDRIIDVILMSHGGAFCFCVINSVIKSSVPYLGDKPTEKNVPTNNVLVL
jgi:hypothetical protein